MPYHRNRDELLNRLKIAQPLREEHTQIGSITFFFHVADPKTEGGPRDLEERIYFESLALSGFIKREPGERFTRLDADLVEQLRTRAKKHFAGRWKQARRNRRRMLLHLRTAIFVEIAWK